MDGLISTTEEKKVEEEFDIKKIFIPLTTIKAVHWIIIIGLIVFVNILFNQFLFDDTGSIVTNPSVHSLSAIPSIFLHQLTGFDQNIFYRPLPFVFYNLIYFLSQANPFYYHLLQLLFYITNAILVFLIFNRFLKINIAFFLALVLLVHPINEETVAYISNLPDILFVFFGLMAVYMFIKNSQRSSYIIMANIALLLSLFSKETGVLFLFFAFLYIFMFNRQKLLLHTICTVLISTLYIFLRFTSHIQSPKIAVVPMMNLNLWERMMSIPAIIFYYIKLFLFPLALTSTNSWFIQKITVSTFILPLIIDCIFFGVIIWLFVSIDNKNKNIALLFFLWFLFGLLMHLQIIPLDATVAGRYFYFPVIGLLALLGLYIEKLKIRKSLRSIVIIAAVLLISLYSIRTIVRNSNWQNQYTLVTHDESLTNNDYLQELLYGNALIKQSKYNEAYPHIQNALKLYPKSYYGWTSLGVVYYYTGNVEKARDAYQKAIKLDDYYGAYDNMALLLVQHDKLLIARAFLRKATSKFPNDDKLWVYRIYADYKTGDFADATLAAKYYFLLRKDNQSYIIYTRLQKGLPVNL